MKKLLLLLLLLLPLAFVNVSFAQQDCQEIDCTGQCGRFIDENYDGFCDHGQLSSEINASQEETISEPEVENNNKTLIIALAIVGLALVGGVTSYVVYKKKK